MKSSYQNYKITGGTKADLNSLKMDPEELLMDAARKTGNPQGELVIMAWNASFITHTDIL